ncbi:MAG: pentapeptide repeat-containing protein [Planctomycetes bacterium]|nr:pentapeptide repeat-containing protein [Planctomycetota bacterium]
MAEEQSYPELSTVDELIAGLEAMINESDESPLTIDTADRPKRAVYRILNDPSPTGRRTRTGEAVFLKDDRLVLRCNTTEVVKLTPLEVVVLADKSGRGETMAVVKGKASGLRRVPGGYDIDIDIGEVRKTRVTPGQKLRECLGKNDATGWNRWCQDIRDTIELVGVDCKRADLTGYDLCCADLTGADLTGANLTGAVLAGATLTHCKLDGVTVTGTDFFRARVSKHQMPLLAACGMPETESVIVDD